MYKQLEKLITLTNNDLNLVNRRFGQRTDITSEQLELLRILFNVNSGLKMLFYGGLKMSFF
ncbi:TPA: hypothetical protein SFT39_002071, partial [Staphylococcus aureus]|nr:hypothetical protein [Staphylococcus aureus]